MESYIKKDRPLSRLPWSIWIKDGDRPAYRYQYYSDYRRARAVLLAIRADWDFTHG